MKNIAILKYTIIFDPSDTWSNGYQFEHDLALFFSNHGKEAKIITSAGGTGERVILISSNNTTEKVAQALQKEVKTTPATNQIKQVQQRTPPKDYKNFQNPKHIQHTPPKLGFNKPGNTNRQKVRYG